MPAWFARSLLGIWVDFKVVWHMAELQACCVASWWASKSLRGIMQPTLPFQVNGILVDLPFSHGNKLQVYRSGVHGFIKTDFEVIVTFDWYSHAMVILPNTYSGAVCGLCGNADGNPQDDFVLPNGQPATDEIQFADSWKVADIPGCLAGCTENCKVCTEAEKRAYRGDKHCGLLVKKQGPFSACHSAIDPAPYFEDCLFDTCIYKGHQEMVCHSIRAYVTACQSQGIRIRQWRTAAFCSTWGSGQGDLLGVACTKVVGFACTVLLFFFFLHEGLGACAHECFFMRTKGLGLARTKGLGLAHTKAF